ncbi:MAG: class I SAM-dependent methyltransferase [Promethearchaeota archaeon]
MVQILSNNKQSVKLCFEKIAKDWDRLRGTPWPVLIDFFEKFNRLDNFCNGFLLDLGCGNGRHTLFFADKTDYLIGVDFSFNLLKIANKKRNLKDIKNVSFVMADITALPFKKDIFSGILFLATLHHNPMQKNRIDSLKEIEQILKKDSYCLISVWRKWQKRFFWHFFKQVFKYIFNFKSFKEFGDILIPWKKQDGRIVQRFYHLFSQREMKKLLQKTDFQVVFMKNFGGSSQRDNIFTIIRKPE